MHAYKQETESSRDRKSTPPSSAPPSDELRVAVTFKRANGADGPTKFSPPLSLSSVKEFQPDPMVVDQALHQLSLLGFQPTRRGNLSVSVRCKRELFEQTFGTQLSVVRLDPKLGKIHPPVNPRNIAFGDKDFRTLYMIGNGLFRVRLDNAGSVQY